LASGGGESVFDRHLDMFGPFIVRPRVIDYDVFVRWNGKRDVDMEAGAVMVFMARCDHCHVASNNVAIVLFQPLYFAFDRSARRLRRIAPFKSHLQWDLQCRSFSNREFPDHNPPAPQPLAYRIKSRPGIKDFFRNR